MKPTEETLADGNESQAPFNVVSDVEISNYKRALLAIDSYLLAPFRIICNDWRGLLGILIIFLYLSVAIIGVRIIPEPQTSTEHQLLLPLEDTQFILGTNASGQGILAQVVHATPTMLKLVFAGGIFAVIVGAIIGMIAGYKGGRTDYLLMIITDSLMTIPGLPLVMVLAFVFQPRNPYLLGVILAINAWTGLARAIRSQVLTLRDMSYVESSRLMGAPLHHILLRDITPGLMPYIAVSFVTASRQVIFDSVALYFLGVLPTADPNWGVMIDQAYSQGGALYGFGALHWMLTPMIAVVMLSLGMILLAQSADRLFNPRIRAKYEKKTGKENTNIK